MSLFSELNELMVKYSFRPEKRFSQHFLVDSAMLQKIMAVSKVSKEDTVLEIGSGCGFVTRELCHQAKKVFGIEKDIHLAGLLRKEMKMDNFELLEGDALELKWPRFSRMVSLPPYSISSDLVFKLLEHSFDTAFLVFQREFAEKLVAEPGFLEYNALSVMAQYQCETGIEFLVSNTCFFPRPPGFSALVRLKKKKRFGKAKNDAHFKSFVKQLFRHRNKSISNSLGLALPFLKKELPFSHSECKEKASGFDWMNEKVYSLEPRQFVELFNKLH